MGKIRRFFESSFGKVNELVTDSDKSDKPKEKKKVVLNSKSFQTVKVKGPCKKGIFEMFPDSAFIVVLDDTGKVIVYEKNVKNTFKNLREVISLFGSKFFKYSILEGDHATEYGPLLKDFYEKSTGLKVRNIYKYKELI
jgi:hypothetical protein